MTEDEKQIVQQISGIGVAVADVASQIVMRLTNLQKITPDEAALILGDVSGHLRDLEKRNQHLPGTAVSYGLIAGRIEEHEKVLKDESGASASRAFEKLQRDTRSGS